MAAATREEIDQLVAELDRGRQAWIGGALESTATSHMTQADHMTLFGPFGGEAMRPIPQQANVAALFRGGSGHLELVQAIAEGDLLVLVLIERNLVRFADDGASRPWVLRTTQVFRRDGASWRRLHRHADPLIQRRGLADTLILLPPGGTP
jgi:ketosteroid isomerase-like protein